MFVDVDYPDLMFRKREVVQKTSELNSILGDMVIDENEEVVLLSSDRYIQIGCDLRDIAKLNEALSQILDLKSCKLLFTAEVSITYMAVDGSDSLLHWAGTLPEGWSCFYASSLIMI